MSRQEIWRKYIDAAISIGANQGLQAVTMREMAKRAGMNTAFLYRAFDDVEDVQLSAFIEVNKTFIQTVLRHISVFDDGVFSKEKERIFFKAIWDEIKRDAEMYEYFLRYYYNYVFPNDYANDDIRSSMMPLLEKMKPLFKEGTDLVRVLLQLLEDLIRYAVRVRNGRIPDDAETAEEVYAYMFGTISSKLAMRISA